MREDSIAALTRLIGEEYRNIVGVVVRKGGKVVYARCFGGFSPDDGVHVFSVTKSVVSALMGVAIGRGLIGSADARVLSFFPEYVPKRGEKTLPRVTLRDVMTMTVPYKYRSSPYTRYFSSDSWVKASLDVMGGRGRVGEFRYAPIVGPDVLTGALQRATGRPVCDFAAETLFEPLGIARKQSIAFESEAAQRAWYARKKHAGEWVADPEGVNTAGWGLTMTADDMARVGQLYLDGGVWNGRRILPADWVAESVTAHSRWNGMAYGFLWWVVDERVGSFAALGDGGNVIYVNPETGIVAAIASLFAPRAKDGVALIRERVEPMFG